MATMIEENGPSTHVSSFLLNVLVLHDSSHLLTYHKRQKIISQHVIRRYPGFRCTLTLGGG